MQTSKNLYSIKHLIFTAEKPAKIKQEKAGG
jgi:hypothetical protein